MKITPQMSELPAEKQALRAVMHTLDRINQSPEVAWHCGYGTQTYSLLVEAGATLSNKPIEKIQEWYPPAKPRPVTGRELRPCPFCGDHYLEEVAPRDEYSSEHRVRCNNCDYGGPIGETPDGAREKWNKRAIQRL